MDDKIFQKLSLLGKAKWQTYNVGTFDAATIKVPDNGFLLLRQIIYNHFCDYATETTKGIIDATVHGLALNELGTSDELYYNFRSPVIPVLDVNSNMQPAIAAGPTVIETWKLFRKSVLIDLARIPAMSTLLQTSGKFLENSEERTSPLGFGVAGPGVNVIGLVVFPATGNYLPNGDSRRVAGTAPGGAGYRDQFRVPIVAANRLNPAPASASEAGQNRAPFITLGFWNVTGSPEQIAELI